MNKLKLVINDIITTKVNIKANVTYALMFTFSILFLFNPLDPELTKLTSFNYTFGQGVASGYDVTKLIRNFNIWFVLGAVSFCFFIKLFSYIRTTYYKENSELSDLTDYLALAGCIVAVFEGITFFDNSRNSSSVYSFSYLLVLSLLCINIFCIILKLDEILTKDSIILIEIFVFSLTVAVSILITKKVRSGMFIVSMALMLLIVLFLLCRFNKKSEGVILRKMPAFAFVTVTISALPALLSLFIEAVYVCFARGRFITNPIKLYSILICIFLIFIVLLFLVINKPVLMIKTAKNISYSFILIGMTMLSNQVAFSQKYGVDLLESANAGVLISDFLNFGKIPVIEHYGGHMLTGVLEGIIYGYVNNDFTGAFISPYANMTMPLITLFMFVLLREIIKEDEAFIFCLLFPFTGLVSYYGLGLLGVILLVHYAKKPGIIRGILLFSGLVAVALYRLDMGFSFVGAVVVSIIIFSVFYKINGETVAISLIRKFKNKENNDRIKCAESFLFKFIIAAIISGGVCLLLWVLLCTVTNQDIIKRLMEFLKISASNLNWAYKNIGKPRYSAYPFVYLFMPFTCLFVLLYSVLSKDFKNKTDEGDFLILISLGTAYFVNYSRGLVRHSLVENNVTTVAWTAYLFFAVFIALKYKKKAFIISIFAFVLVNNLFVTEEVFREKNIADRGYEELREHVGLYTEPYEDEDNIFSFTAHSGEKVNRVSLDDNAVKKATELSKVLDVVLKENETYIDLLNRTSLYSILGKEVPVYVSQSPLQLSGEYTQERFIEELEDKKDTCFIAILPGSGDENDGIITKLDGIMNSYRYYLVSEYIYNNFTPLFSYADFTVFARNEKADYVKQLIKGEGFDDVSYIIEQELHYYELSDLPMIFGELSDNTDSLISEGFEKSGDYYSVNKNYDESNPLYVKIVLDYECSSENVEDGYITFYNNENCDIKTEYKFTLHEGKHIYMFRVSADYLWHEKLLDKMLFTSDGTIKEMNVCIE